MGEAPNRSYYVTRNQITALNYRQDGKSTFVTIPSGAILSLLGELKPFGMVEVQYLDRTLAVPCRDILEHAEQQPGEGI